MRLAWIVCALGLLAGCTVSGPSPSGEPIAQVDIGAAPWGLALAPGGRAYVATAEGVAVVDTA